MRISHPLVPVIGFIALALLGVAFVVLKALAWLRHLRWSSELERRRTLTSAVAEVAQMTRITDQGHHRLVVKVAAATLDPYRAVQPSLSLRGITILTPGAVAHAEKTGTLPILFAPARPTKLVVDLVALGEEGEARAVHARWASPEWEVVAKDG